MADPATFRIGSATATRRIMVDGEAVGFMFRDAPGNDADSGWRFMSGTESEAYITDPENHGLYRLDLIAAHDPTIVPLLEKPLGSAFQRDPVSNELVAVDYAPPED
jgi:hypothetical protein